MRIQFSIISLIIILFLIVKCGGRSDSKIIPLTKSWEIAIPNQEVPEGLTSISSEQCGVCHQDHYDEWKMSTHSHAWTDLQFQAELKKETNPFMCINCHIPLQNQQEYIITGLIDGDIYQPVKELNPKFDPALKQEGVNCAACHIRDNAIVGPTGSDLAPHKTVKDPTFLSESLCLSCHNTTGIISSTLVCTFETGDEWKKGPYFGKKNCINCHMDTISREIVPGYGNKLSHQHYFSGSGIPKLDSLETTILNGLSFSPSPIKSSYSREESVSFNLKVKNEFAGHNVPTGDPERFIIIRLEIRNEIGEIVKEEVNRIGEEWQWYPTAKKISDNNFVPSEERNYTINYQTEVRGKYSLIVNVEKHRLDRELADYNKLTSVYPLSILIYEEQYFFMIE